MAFLFLAANATYIWYLIPIPGRSQSFENRMKEWHEFTDLMTQRFDDHETAQRQPWLLLLSAGGVLLLNFIFRWLPSGLLINTLMVLPGLLFVSRRAKPTPPLTPPADRYFRRTCRRIVGTRRITPPLPIVLGPQKGLRRHTS
jgi:hypothetical protein